ncbi:NRDE family protein [Oceanobacillus sp. CAU 1775]
MCLINFHLQKHPKYKLVIAANRDEFYGRPTDKAHFWPDASELLAGRDLLQKGTWLGVTKTGRFAALTNIRDLSLEGKDKKSRGGIVSGFLNQSVSPVDYLEEIRKNKDSYAGFNILVGDSEKLFHYNNLYNVISEVTPGTHSLSNDTLNTPWPKVVKGKTNLNHYVTNEENLDPNKLFEILENAEQAPDSDLPDTGIGAELERSLSASFIKTPEYGTRSATVLLIDNNNNVDFIERTYTEGVLESEQKFNFSIKNTEKEKLS